jgi:DNA-directed RNA polymerase specialized sigma24 family protein
MMGGGDVGRESRDAGLSTKEMARRYRSGETVVMIAAAAGLDLATVHGRLKRAGVKLRPRGRSPRLVLLGATDAKLVARYRAGETLDGIAVATGLSPSAVKYRLRRAGVAMRRTGKAPGQGRLDLPVAEIIRRYRAGQSTYEIGRALDVSAPTIRERLIEAGVKRRRRGSRGGKVEGTRPKPAGRKGT